MQSFWIYCCFIWNWHTPDWQDKIFHKHLINKKDRWDGGKPRPPTNTFLWLLDGRIITAGKYIYSIQISYYCKSEWSWLWPLKVSQCQIWQCHWNRHILGLSFVIFWPSLFCRNWKPLNLPRRQVMDQPHRPWELAPPTLPLPRLPTGNIHYRGHLPRCS